jgi:four helix bundle protein
MHHLKELKIWQKSVELSIAIYKVIKHFPKEETYGLTSQIRRAAVSIPSNIAEGAGRDSQKEFVHFLSIANGSAYELQTQLLIAHRLNFIEADTLKALLNELDEIQKMIYTFQKHLQSKP